MKSKLEDALEIVPEEQGDVVKFGLPAHGWSSSEPQCKVGVWDTEANYPQVSVFFRGNVLGDCRC